MVRETRARGVHLTLDSGDTITFLAYMYGDGGAKFARIINKKGMIEVISTRRIKEDNEDQSRAG